MRIPYFSSCSEWVDSLPYGEPLHMYKGKDCGGYVYGNPYESVYGTHPEVVYNRLFNQWHYYGISDEELIELRSTIQYFPVYLDSFFERKCSFLESMGFVRYRRLLDDKVRGVYFRNGDISLFTGNVTTPQDFEPNMLDVEFAKIVNGRRRHLKNCKVFLPDNFGKLSVGEFERNLSEFKID